LEYQCEIAKKRSFDFEGAVGFLEGLVGSSEV
jgi:hypothetical protein